MAPIQDHLPNVSHSREALLYICCLLGGAILRRTWKLYASLIIFLKKLGSTNYKYKRNGETGVSDRCFVNALAQYHNWISSAEITFSSRQPDTISSLIYYLLFLITITIFSILIQPLLKLLILHVVACYHQDYS